MKVLDWIRSLIVPKAVREELEEIQSQRRIHDDAHERRVVEERIAALRARINILMAASQSDRIRE